MSNKQFTTVADLEAALLGQIKQRQSADHPLIVGIAGGSASGKTTVAGNVVRRLGERQAKLFSQDLFQFGRDFAGRKTSLYKFDDPENFDLDVSAEALQMLRNNKTATVPNYEVVANLRQGTVDIKPAPVIIWEGVYALLTAELQAACDLTVYVDAAYPLRFMRRVSRFLARQESDDMSVPARHMLSFVLLADTDFVSPQRQHAEYILDVHPHDLEDEIALFEQRAAKHAKQMIALPTDEPLCSGTYGSLSFQLYAHAFAICNNGKPLYVTDLPPESVASARRHWDYIVQA